MTGPSARTQRGRTWRCRTHVIADAAQDARERREVAAAEGGKQQLSHDFDVAGQDALQECPPRGRDGHRGAAFVVDGGGPGEEPYLLQLPDLIRQAAAAEDDVIGEIGHTLVAVGSASELREDFKLDVAQAAIGTQLLLDGVVEQAADLHQDEVGGKLFGVEGCSILHARKRTTVRELSQNGSHVG